MENYVFGSGGTMEEGVDARDWSAMPPADVTGDEPADTEDAASDDASVDIPQASEGDIPAPIESGSEENADEPMTAEDNEPDSVTLESLNARMDELVGLFTAKIEHSEYELEVARRYSDELQEYRSDLFDKITKPLLRGIVEVASGMRKAADACQHRGESAIPLDTFSLYREELEDMLTDYGIAFFSPQVGDDFISGEHKIVGKGIPTADNAKARTIAEVKGGGYRNDNGIIAPARVCVYVLDENAAEDTQATSSASVVESPSNL